MSRELHGAELNAPFLAARRLLGVTDEAPLQEIKRAYRAAVALHPPEREPEAFGRIRSAYELLSDPIDVARERLEDPTPAIPPPSLAAPPPPGDLLLAVLRLSVGRLSADVALTAPPKARPRKPAIKTETPPS